MPRDKDVMAPRKCIECGHYHRDPYWDEGDCPECPCGADQNLWMEERVSVETE